MEPSGDISCSLGDIRTRLSAPICATLLEIQKHQFSKQQSVEWISNLECLSIPSIVGQKRRYGEDGEFVEVEPLKMVLGRRKINPVKNFKERDYVAVSWAWEPEPEEELAVGSYLIESRGEGGGQQLPSNVRDIVLERVIKYANCTRCNLFWIDRICINQDDEEELEIATQAMDLVYSLSQKSLAIINRHIRTDKDLNILTEFMMGRFVDFKGDLSMLHKAGMALELIEWLTSAGWWMRAWTFQEDYKASVNMVLLISHDPALEQLKRSKRIFEIVPGELCVNSADFRAEVTKFCQAYQHFFRSNSEDVKICSKILERAGKYTIKLCEKDEDGGDIIQQPMTPTILADIGARQITKPWDRLAIVANCCNYDIRLNANELGRGRFSHSLAILTQHLLNGEIINNGQSDNHLPTRNIFNFLKSQSLDSFESPIEAELTFIKGCRLTGVELVNEGVQTSGHLWKVEKRIKVKCETKLPGEDPTRGGLEGHQRYRLKQLAHELGSGVYGRSYKILADNLLYYLDEEKQSKDSFAKQYMYWMASEIVHAMTDPRKVLRLGCLVGRPNNTGAPYRGIFVCDANDQSFEYIFTTSRQSSGNWGEIDKHVSLGVELLNPNAEGVPELITKKWVNGLYFASGWEKRKVLFPWLDIFKI
ncbi:hypothetical protein G7Y89_g2411 [Cudoniella acicularis]|uniref:Heterokaryon incompatibility domain-containing protein n=1 Tax=Cudoniella acicularis TaxID=354080 RepID=A0A8H4W9D5_9HELO|nr:hypothetical protein G7Y89_g2411 [Cudoniella acicularis]